MGRDKAQIEVDGIPLIRRIYDACVSGEVKGYVVTPWVEQYRSLLPSDCILIREEEPHRGPLLGFSQGLPYLTSEWVLLLACDLLYLSTTAIASWVSQLDRLPAETMAYLPKNAEKGWEPLCGFYRRGCLPSLLAYINTGDRSFQGWLKGCSVTELVVTNPQWLFNCNTQADLAKQQGIKRI
jgi:molybdopterin-guanine dinucleotide biosynthesis protein A